MDQPILGTIFSAPGSINSRLVILTWRLILFEVHGNDPEWIEIECKKKTSGIPFRTCNTTFYARLECEDIDMFKRIDSCDCRKIMQEIGYQTIFYRNMLLQNFRRSIVSAKAKGLSGDDQWAVKQQHIVNAIICPKKKSKYHRVHILPTDWEPYNITIDESVMEKEYCCSRFIIRSATHYSGSFDHDHYPNRNWYLDNSQLEKYSQKYFQMHPNKY
jgi:hypothetical protein